MDLTNRTLGAYRAIRPIAEGGFSEIWKAAPATGKGDKVAIKVMKPEMARRPADRKMFMREFSICSKLKHRGILRFIEEGEFDSVPFIVMELFEAPNMRRLMADKSPVLMRDAFAVMHNCADALGYAHHQGIVHRDVKPENILVDDGGDVRVIDFSIAHTKMQRFLSRVFKSRDGTPSYMAPEVVLNKPATPQSDIYSLGVVFFEMFAGKAPFVGDTDNETLNLHVKGKPPRLSRQNTSVCPELDKLVMSMLRKEPAERPRTMGDVVRRLKSPNMRILLDV